MKKPKQNKSTQRKKTQMKHMKEMHLEKDESDSDTYVSPSCSDTIDEEFFDEVPNKSINNS
jgi:hypothetical protein